MEVKRKKGNRKYSEEFKREAVELALKVGYTTAGKDLGVNEANIRAWNSQQKKNALDPNKKTYEEIARELKRLNKENSYLKEINKVLKKSTAIFSQDLMGDFK